MRIEVAKFSAFVVDLDGVVTKTAEVHAVAWKRLFDDLLARTAGEQPWQPFDLDREYRAYVDGKPRLDGLRDFLAARGISILEGTPQDSADLDTIYGLAKRKNRYVLESLGRGDVGVHADSVGLLQKARTMGVRLAVVTASENCAAVLAAAHLHALFAAQIDGLDLARLRLRGKPAPDSFLEATRRLGVEPSHAVVFEDAIAGVQAGRAGGFGLVIGVDRVGRGDALHRAGADVVVTSLDEIELVRGETRAEPL
ncbi:MAG TPA: beta-phosphoglucomutase family hydrolase [Kofleriaceae bacterium]